MILYIHLPPTGQDRLRQGRHALLAVRSLRNDRQFVQVKKNFIYTVL